jgi:hypothetical protein
MRVINVDIVVSCENEIVWQSCDRGEETAEFIQECGERFGVSGVRWSVNIEDGKF